jgi:hypothetical protein
MLVVDLGVLTKAEMHALLRPGAIDPARVRGYRVRFSYRAVRGDEKETRSVANELKALHERLGATDVLIHSAPSSDG